MSDDGTPWRVEADVSGVTDSAALVEQAFGRAFDAVERQIGKAARTGELSFRAMVVLANLAAFFAGEPVKTPVPL